MNIPIGIYKLKLKLKIHKFILFYFYSINTKIRDGAGYVFYSTGDNNNIVSRINLTKFILSVCVHKYNTILYLNIKLSQS